MDKHASIPKLLAALALLPLHAAVYAQTRVDPPEMEAIGPYTNIWTVPPTTNWLGTRGLSQTGSAEALGEGRLIFGFHGSGFEQQREFPGSPNRNAKIFTGTGALSYGMSPYVDVFADLSGYGSMDYRNGEGSHLGSVGGGLQGTFPFVPESPIRLAAQAGIFQGLSNNQVNTIGADGYNYFETRTGLDFLGRLIQTVTFGEEASALKLHVNEGVVTSAESGRDPLLLLATGIQMNTRYAALGLEGNSRTQFKDIDFAHDPLWITPSIQFRTAYNVNASIGGDISVSTDRSGGQRSLEPYRLFGGLALTFDTKQQTRWEIRERERMRLMERSKQEARNREMAAKLEKAKADSAMLAQQQATSDSLAREAVVKARQDSLSLTEKARQDSMSMANKARQDSAALQAQLADERSKRSEMENQLLNTGMLLLDAVYFETGKSQISINSKPYLNVIAKMLTKYPKLQIEVAGHTDNVGSDSYNQRLSQDRADAVKLYLMQAEPSLNGRLTAMGYGEAKPKASNATSEGRQQNRRTQLEVINKDALMEYNPSARAPEL